MTDPRPLGLPDSSHTDTPFLGPAGGLLPAEPQELAPPPAVTHHAVTFTGSAGEYFRIWIVNAALTLVTLGVYLPWARVRTRQYFYGHTWLDGQNFEYRANPAALLRGYLIVGAFFLAYSLTINTERLIWVGLIILGVFGLLYPWLVRQSMRFQAVNTLHRGLRFHFGGTLGGAYVAYGAANIVAYITSIFGLPWAWFMQRRYQVDNLSYGTGRGHFRGDVAPFYLIGLTALGLSLGGVVAVLVVFGVPLLLTFGALGDRSGLGALGVGAIAGLAAGYLLLLALLFGVGQYLRAATMKYVLDHAELGGVVRTGTTFSPWRLAWISLSNAAAQLLTLGLATPWAAVRRARYVLDGIQVRTIASLDDFAAAASPPESALGEAASELLDIGIGF